MTPLNFYSAWRTSNSTENLLRDGKDVPAERLLQSIWRHQRLRRDALHTDDGRSVRILHPGFVSLEGGPDFRGALIQIDGASPQSGDVEIDVHPGGWHAHGHDRNPAFQNVLLRIVWNEVGVHTLASAKSPTQPGSARRNREMPDKLKPEIQPLPPLLAIHDKLDAPIAELALWLEKDSPRVLPENLRGRCCTALRELEEPWQDRILDAAAHVRFQAKAEWFRARARHAGGEQSFWEGLFRALGYKHNLWPMQSLAESRLRWLPEPASAFVLQSRLLGLSGLLPAELPRLHPASRGFGAASARAQTGDDYIRKLWDGWWRERDGFSDCQLPRAVWKFHGLRPANHPQRRLALAAHWLASGDLIQKLESWCTGEIPDRKLSGSLRAILEVKGDEFWSWHWTFRSPRLKKTQPLLGDARVTDLAVNVILPWFWMRAREGGNEKIRRVVEHRYAAWPAAEDNAVLKLARQRLLGVGRFCTGRGASAQQGLLQIARDFCEHSNALCDNCRFPELVRGWRAAGDH